MIDNDWHKTYNKEEVDVVKTESLQTLVESQLAAGVVGSPDLGDNENILALDTRLESSLEASTDLILVAVAVGAINELVTLLESVCNSSLDLTGLGLPGTETNGRNLLAVVELEASGGHCVCCRKGSDARV